VPYSYVAAFTDDCRDAIYAVSHIKADWVALRLQVLAAVAIPAFRPEGT
jgi:hypothetical protein